MIEKRCTKRSQYRWRAGLKKASDTVHEEATDWLMQIKQEHQVG